MKAIYIHGLDTQPNLEKIEAMEDSGFQTSALHLNYRTKSDSFEILKKFIKTEKIEFVVGSSMGGFLGYWLAADMGLPCLLLNPALTFDYSNQLVIPDNINDSCPFRFVVMGAKDDIVDPEQSNNFLELHANGGFQRIISASWMGHIVDTYSFREFITWFKYSYLSYVQSC